MVQDVIGEGTYGRVHKVVSRRNNRQTLAVKEFKPTKDDEGISQTAVREVAVLRELRHVHIVRLVAVHTDPIAHSLQVRGRRRRGACRTLQNQRNVRLTSASLASWC